MGELSPQDERIAEYFRTISENKKPNKGNPVENILEEQTLTNIDTKKFEKSVNLLIMVKLWSKHAD